MRYTTKDAKIAFKRLCKVLGKTPGYKKGNWCLDCNATYGGCVVREMLENGGEGSPMGMSRRTPKAFCYLVSTIEELIQAKVLYPYIVNNI